MKPITAISYPNNALVNEISRVLPTIGEVYGLRNFTAKGLVCAIVIFKDFISTNIFITNLDAESIILLKNALASLKQGFMH